MKKYFFYLSIALVAFVVASCGLKGNHTSSGRAYELLVVVDHGVWDRAAGRALHDALDSDVPGLPQSEPSFRIMYTSPKDYDSTLKLIRNIIIVDIQDIYTKASFKYAKDVYANPQMILTIQAPNEEEFGKFVEENKKTDAKEEPSSLININTAGEEQLCTLPGVGSSKAKSIIAWREKNGAYRSIEEIMNVEGIKEGVFEKIKDSITV